MKKFVLYFFFFLAPIFLLWSIKIFVYETSGDLGRLGKIVIPKSYRLIYSEYYQRNMYFEELSNPISKSSKKKRILVVGDSFSSGQGINGYVNVLAADTNLAIVLFERRKMLLWLDQV